MLIESLEYLVESLVYYFLGLNYKGLHFLFLQLDAPSRDALPRYLRGLIAVVLGVGVLLLVRQSYRHIEDHLQSWQISHFFQHLTPRRRTRLPLVVRPDPSNLSKTVDRTFNFVDH